MKKLLFLALFFSCSFVYADETYINGKKASIVEIQEFNGLSSDPSVAPTNKGRIFYQASSDTLQVSLNGGAYQELGGEDDPEGLSFTFQSFGEIITAGTNVWKPVPYNCTVTGWDAISSSSGTTTVDILKSNYTDPTAWTSIAGSELPSITSSTKNQDLNLTTWAVNLTVGDYVMANVTSTDVSGKVHVNLWGKRR